MKLIKISQDHYVIVDENAEIKEGDLCYDPEGIPGYNNVKYVVKCLRTAPDSYWNKHSKKITHSTEPLDCACSNRGYKLDTNCAERNRCFDKVQYLTHQEVKELIGEVDVEKKAEKFIGCEYEDIEDNIDQIGYDSFIRAYNQALEDNKEKKWTDEDVIYFVNKSRETGLTAEYLMLTKQPKTEWEVELIDGQLKLKQ